MLPANEIRQQFIDFFVKRHGHTFVPSSPVVPHDDATLLFTNAGMNQFKPIFLGLEKRPYVRAANTQKCIRAGGKHNDLDDVGKDTYHHTFFEMLGNWSFGDYFKREAIQWAWELLTDVWKMDRERLHVTVFGGDKNENLDRDDEARQFWIKEAGVDPSRVHSGSKKDNFWEMGNTGPCGPCTEIHYDRTPDKSGGKLVNAGVPEVIEIWNLVFIQYNRGEDGKLTPLPARHVDTGMGFERVTAVFQGKDSNYDTDVFTPIISAIGKLTGRSYGGKLTDSVDIAFRAIADHLRMSTFAITDGVRPGNKKREAVLRSVIRRAVRFGYQFLDRREPFLFTLVPVLVDEMGGAFPELKAKPQETMNLLRAEEKDFYRTIKVGLTHFDTAAEAARKSGGSIDGETAAKLHHTHGFPIDLTEQMALESGLTVDRKGYDEAMDRHRRESGDGRDKLIIEAVKGELPKTDDSPKFGPLSITAKVSGWVKDNTVFREGSLRATETVAILLDRTNFYAEQGGQVGDIGRITGDGMTFLVEDTQRLGDTILHSGVLTDGTVKVGQTVTASVTDRSNTVRNHTATHLLNLALRDVLGPHVEQKGSLVDAEKTRFDFSHDKPLTTDEVRRVEELVNQQILRDLPVTPINLPLAEAKKIPGVRAVFGEKYPDPVRVVMIGAEKPEQATDQMSVEFCGGTHLSRTGPAGLFKIVSQENVAKGVRRVTAVTGQRAVDYVQEMSDVLGDLTSRFNCSVAELPKRVESLQDELKKLQKQLQKGATGDLNSAADKLLAEAREIKGSKLVVGELPTAPVEAMRAQIDRLRQKAGSSIIVLGWKNEDGTAGLAVGVSDDLVKKGIKSNDVIKPVAEVVGGKGGGPPHLATAGGKDANKLSEALTRSVQLGTELLNR
jgi:alanyl-tRNA synthetase